MKPMNLTMKPSPDTEQERLMQQAPQLSNRASERVCNFSLCVASPEIYSIGISGKRKPREVYPNFRKFPNGDFRFI